MNLRSPIAAMLWENWQLTRVEVGQRLGFGLVLGAGALVLSEKGPILAFTLLMTVYSMVWFSIAKLSGGRLSDGYKPGFPLPLLYSRPVPTTMLVGVAMFYNAISCTALYLISAALLGFVFGQPLPLLSVTLILVSWHLAYTCAQWATRSRVFQWIVSIAFSFPMFFLLINNITTPLGVEFSLVENVVLVLVGVVSIALTFAGVARQRRGDSVAVVPQQKEWSGGYPDWLVTLFGFRCPTTSATRAQVWFELRSSGLPVLTIGFGVSMLILLLYAISTSIESVRYVAIPLAILSVPIALLGLGNNAFGIRRKQGRTYASPFEATQPCSTAKLTGLKVLVRTACVLVALIAIGASLWASSSLLSTWGQWFMDGNKDALPDLLKVRQKISDAFGGLTGYAHAALAIVATLVVAGVVTWQAAREALRARYPRLLLVVQWLPAVWGLTIILLALAARNGITSMNLAGEFFTATFWISAAAFLFATTYLLWSGLAERALTMRYACGAFALAAAFGAAWRAGMPATGIDGLLWLVLGMLMIIVLAPWSLSRARHI